MTDDATAQARAALGEVVPSLVSLLRGVPDATVGAVGSWTVGDVAAHLSHVFHGDTAALVGPSLPSATVTTAGIADLNAGLLAADDERDAATLADRIEHQAREFDEAAARSRAETVEWLGGAPLAPSAVAGHLLEECLVHGHDIARATGRRWTIQPRHALVAIERGILPLVAALPPGALVDPRTSLRARFDLRLRGGGRTTMVFDGGSLTLDPTGTHDIDAHVSAAPGPFMLMFIGRDTVVNLLLRGQLAAWGRRPWKLVPMLAALSPP